MMQVSFQDQKEQNYLDQEKRMMPLREYWHLYAALLATGILTAFAGVYLGLAPSRTGDIIFNDAWDALRRVFFAVYYALSFLLVAEGATLFAKEKLIKRDVELIDGQIRDVVAQRRSMTAMLWVSVGAIVATTVAAGTMLASWLGALDNFVTIPAAAQSWIVLGPPALLVFDVVMVLIYQQNSKQSEIDRWIQQQKRLAESDAQSAYAEEYVRQYKEVAPDAARRAATVAANQAARRWAGASIASQQALPPAPRLVEGPKLPEPQTEEDMLFLNGAPPADVREEQGYPNPVREAALDEPDRSNGNHPAAVMEGGTDQFSPT